jgi:hypothetical protein
VHVGHDAEGILISTVNVKPCSFLIKEIANPAVQSAGVVRFFDTATGKWECPPDAAVNQTAAKR